MLVIIKKESTATLIFIDIIFFSILIVNFMVVHVLNVIRNSVMRWGNFQTPLLLLLLPADIASTISAS